ncbi:MAG: zinc ribbon domain-containing protein [Thermodesulfovibrionales bacterium]|nr:zinc ribbon domain-containing protein [Thermodesulfovibrionales bacterium]MDP3110539.1 zinc ribbon domain-containing protein [Thermodesulfovibrionales bacterium]
MLRYVILLAIAGIVGSIIAIRKGRSPMVWFFLCAIVPLLIAVIIVLPPLASKGYTKRCPYCAEIIKKDAIVCKHCGRELPIEMIKVNNKM